MNDEPSSSAAPPAAAANDDVESSEPRLTASQIADRKKKNRENFNKKRGELLDDLLNGLDILIYAELSVIYHMDCSFVRFAMRAFLQFMFLSPKPAMLPDPPLNVGFLFGSSIICILFHAIYSAPSAGEATRGYMHGGLAMDFIGQKGPSSKIHLLLLDVLLVLLQAVNVSAFVLRKRIKENLATATTTTTNTAPSAGQSLEDEEQGVRRSAELQRADDIEMQTLTQTGEATTLPTTHDEPDPERSTLLAQPRSSDRHIFDAFNSGQIVLADFQPWTAVKEQYLVFLKDTREQRATGRDEHNRLIRQQFAARALEGFQRRFRGGGNAAAAEGQPPPGGGV